MKTNNINTVATEYFALLKVRASEYAKSSIMLPEFEIGSEVYEILYNEKLIEFYKFGIRA